MNIHTEQFGKFLVIDIVIYAIIFGVFYTAISYSMGVILLTDDASQNHFIQSFTSKGLWYVIGVSSVPTYLVFLYISSSELQNLNTIFICTNVSKVYKFVHLIIQILLIVSFGVLSFLIFSDPICEKSYCIMTFFELVRSSNSSIGEAIYAFNKFTMVLDNSVALACFLAAFRALIVLVINIISIGFGSHGQAESRPQTWKADQ